MEIVIPNLGDIDEVEVIEICVAVGDELAENDAIVVIESDKASMEVPSPAAGVLTALRVSVGDMVGEGTVLADLQTENAAEAAEQQTQEQTQEQPSPASIESSEQTSASDTKNDMQASTPNAESDQSSGLEEIDVLVPDIGDAGDVVVIEIAVQAGDEVDLNDLLVVLESDKASMEIAAEHPGKVLQVAVSEGQEVSEGSLIATMSVRAAQSQAVESKDVADAQETSVTPTATASTPADTSPAAAVPQALPSSQSAAGAAAADVVAAAKVYAGPAVRRLARELGVELGQVIGTGNRGRVTKDDVKAFVKSQLGAKTSTSGDMGGWPKVAEIDFTKFGAIETVPLSRIRQRGAENLHRSWVNLPHVTQHDEADITNLEEFRASLKQEAQDKDVKVTPLAFLIKACSRGLQTFPEFNASLHPDGKQLVLKQYINVGVAVDTPEGLVVPVIKDAANKSIWQLSAEIAQLSEKARDRKLSIDDLQGGTFSISSLGALGGTGFTPIVNAPEVAILGVAKLQTKPVWNGDSFQPRKMLPLSLSYDHRVINGADGGRFMQFLVGVLSDVRRLSL